MPTPTLSTGGNTTVRVLSHMSFQSSMKRARECIDNCEYLSTVNHLINATVVVGNMQHLEELIALLEVLLDKVPEDQEGIIKSKIQNSGIDHKIKCLFDDKVGDLQNVTPKLLALLAEPRLAAPLQQELRTKSHEMLISQLPKPLLRSTIIESDRALQAKINEDRVKLLQHLDKHEFTDARLCLDYMISACRQIKNKEHVLELGYRSVEELEKDKEEIESFIKARDKSIEAIYTSVFDVVDKKYKLRSNCKIGAIHGIVTRMQQYWMYVTEQDKQELPSILANLVVINLTTPNVLSRVFLASESYINDMQVFKLAINTLLAERFVSRTAASVKLSSTAFKPS